MNAQWQPLVSVVMATCDRAHFLGPAIDSVLKQSVADLELLIADDGSGEATRRVLQAWKSDPRVHAVFQDIRATRQSDFVNAFWRYLAFDPALLEQTWAEAKAFAHDVSEQMARDNPDLYLIKMTKSLREGRIFLDYLRNDRMATAVAPLSPRARPGATVSMPLSWSDVKPDLDPKRYTIRTAPGLMEKNSAWQDYGQGERSLAQAIKRLQKRT